MIPEDISVSRFLKTYGIDYFALDDEAKESIEKDGDLPKMTKALEYLVNIIGVSPRKIEKCPSVLYLNPGCIKGNYETLVEKGINREKILGCLHILSSEPGVISETFDYIADNYGVETFNKNVSILGIPVSRIKEMERFSSKISKNAILSAAITTLRPAEVGNIISICEEYGVEVSGSFFQKGVGEISEIVRICKEYNLEVNGSMFRKSSFELRKIIAICNEKNVPVTGSVFLKGSEEVGKIIDTCRRHNIPISGSVFRKDADQIDEIVKVCEELGIEISGTVFLRDAEEIRRIHSVCSKYGISISGTVFKKSADEIEEIVNVCNRYGLDVSSTLFKKSASSLEKSMSYIQENFGRSYLTPLIVITDVNHLQKVFPYLDSKGVLPAVVNSPAILGLKFEEMIEREKMISQLGEEDVVNGRFNPIYGLSRKKYSEKKEMVSLKGVGVK